MTENAAMASHENASVSLRHVIATLAYRAGKTLRSPPAGFGEFRAAPSTRRAIEIVGHMADLMEWAATSVNGKTVWREGKVQDWDHEVARFFSGVKALDDRLASGEPIACDAEKLFQGPLADALTHVGQLATLRRLVGEGVRGENYYVAEIESGRVGLEQAKAVREFD
jgi:hypothetical protein